MVDIGGYWMVLDMVVDCWWMVVCVWHWMVGVWLWMVVGGGFSCGKRTLISPLSSSQQSPLMKSYLVSFL